MIELEYKYYEFIKKWKDRYELRLKLVQDAIAHGIKPTARKYGTTVKTVRKWVKRYEADKKAGLEERSRKPQRSPQATKPWVLFKLIHEAGSPGAKTFQSDVESFHRWVEEELYAAESFGSKKTEFLMKAAYYQAQFNCQRYNHYKRGTPLELVRETYPELEPEALFMKPVILDNLLVQYKAELAQLVA